MPKDFKSSLDIKTLKRFETTIIKKDNKLMNKEKFLRLNVRFKSLKEQIKKTIILRPEGNNEKDKDSINSINKKRKNSISRKNKSNILINNIVNFNIYKNKKTSKSNNNLLEIKPNFNFGLINKSETIKRNNINKNNIIYDHSSEQTTSIKKLNSETEKQEDIKPNSNKESSKNDSIEDFSTHSIKRKNNVFYEKYRIIIHKGIIYDSLDDEELEDEEEINSFYIEPHSLFNITFDTILMIISIISLFEIPLYLATNHNFCRTNFRYIDGINLFIECLNGIDLFLGFFRAYYNWDEQLIKKNKKIAFKYLTGWFLFDLIASIPVYTLIKLHEPICLYSY